MVFEETSIGLDGMAMVLNGSQPLVKRSIIGNKPSVRSNPKLGHGIFPVSFFTAKIMVGQDILCKFLVNNVIAYHLWTITSPLIARGGLGIGEHRVPDFCPRRYLSFKSSVEVCLSQVLHFILFCLSSHNHIFAQYLSLSHRERSPCFSGVRLDLKMSMF